MSFRSAYPMALALLTSLAQAQDAEQVFTQALDYTVRVKAQIPTPFIEDEQGVFTGAGFIVSADRKWVLTNGHVVGHSPSTVRVAVYGGEYEEARKIYVDPYVDVAVLELSQELSSANEAMLACDEPVGTGHYVGAFGHPWGLDYTGTQGVISGRTPKFGGELLQTDAPINSGNSGGPLISLTRGDVVGISTASISQEDDQNTNFAVPIAHACRILELLLAEMDPSPPDLPVIFFDRGDPNKTLIVAETYLEPQLLDLRPGDEIVSVFGEKVTNEGQLIHQLRGRLDDARIKVQRSGAHVSLSGRLSPAPRVTERRGVLFSGILFAHSGMRDKSVLGLGHDIMVHSIEQGSEANGNGLYYYDYLQSVNGTRIQSLEHLYRTLAELSDGKTVQLDFIRAGTTEAEGQLFAQVRREIVVSPPEHFGAWPSNVLTNLREAQ